ncbi:MAG: hypothetical protein GW928_00165 [Rhodoferax sp.]|nr:hypothetical protein [Rhodoferax sp.]OIP18531.1 MAG: hypothetical protein AUK50_05975 [Comamonadaceae bacterium CG2_30_57_122]
MAEFVNALLGLMVRLVLFLAGLSLILLLAWMLQRRLRGTTLWGAQGAARYSNGQQRSEQPSMTFTGKYLQFGADQVPFANGVNPWQRSFSADSMEFDNLGRVLLLKGWVRGMLLPGVAP